MGGKHGRLKAMALGVLASALAAMYLAATAAAAHSPIYLDPLAKGEPPSIVGTSDGGVVASFTYDETLGYCRLAPEATACSVSGFVTEPLGYAFDFGNAPIVAGGPGFGLLDTRSNEVEQKKYFTVVSSTGAVVSTKEVANNAGGGSLGFSQLATSPAGATTPNFLMATINGGEDEEGATLAAAETNTLTPGSKFVVSKDPINQVSTASSAIAVQSGIIWVAWIELHGGPKIYTRRLGTTVMNAGQVQNEGLWSTPVQIGEASVTTPIQMASGPGGLYVAYQEPSDGAVVVQHMGANFTFEAPYAITEPETAQYAIAEDEAGRLHVVYTLQGPETYLHYSYAKNISNSSFTYPQILGETEYRDLKLVAHVGGGGWVAWHDNDGDGSYVMQLDPGEGAGPPKPPSAGGGGGGSTGGGSGTTKKSPPKTVTGPTATTKSSLGHGLVGELSVPKQCLPENAVFGARLRVKRKGSAAHKASYSVKKVKFTLGGSALKTDLTKPFEARFLTTGLKRDSALTVAAKVSVALHQGHRSTSVTKSLTAKVRTCK
jgi:hypothetical protein